MQRIADTHAPALLKWPESLLLPRERWTRVESAVLDLTTGLERERHSFDRQPIKRVTFTFESRGEVQYCTLHTSPTFARQKQRLRPLEQRRSVGVGDPLHH